MVKPFQVHSTKRYYGPNLYAHSAIIFIDIQFNASLYTKMISTCDKLIQQFPLLKQG